MLDELLVENLGLIGSAHIEPGPGLVAVTGETGAGKTLLLGALRLLRGDTARTDRVGPGGDQARVEGRFLVGGEEIAVGRRVGEERSRAYLDGSMVPARALAERVGPLVEIVGQHEHLTLGSERVVRAMIDAGLGSRGAAVRQAYLEAYRHLAGLLADREALGGDRRALEREHDLVSYQADEIAAAALSSGEDTALAESLGRLRHAEEIAEALAVAHGMLGEDGGAVDLLGRAARAVERMADLDPSLAALARRLGGAAAEAADLAVDLRREGDDIDHDPGELERAEHRMSTISDLIRRYGATVDAVLAYGEAQRRRGEELAALLDRADGLSAEIATAESEVGERGRELTEVRRTAGTALADRAAAHLRDLGFRDPKVEVAVEASEPGPGGADRCTLRFASDASLPAGPVSRVASGGELSRLVLAMRLGAAVGDVPVIAFDEIDAGIGGSTALAMGQKLAALAADRQVLVVTHLPQVAAFAATHIVVERSGVTASVRTVSGADRLEEIARMLGGLPESERGRSHADELLAIAASRS